MLVKVLVIEDEPDIRKTVEYNLTREGYEVSGCGSISEAKALLENPNFSIILLDLMLPDGSGLDLCKQIKSNPESNEIPILILTAKDDEVDKVVGFELGADDYVTKPFSVRELILRVKAILKRNTKTISSSNQIHEINRNFGSLKIDLESYEVFINDEEVILTTLEFISLSLIFPAVPKNVHIVLSESGVINIKQVPVGNSSFFLE